MNKGLLIFLCICFAVTASLIIRMIIIKAQKHAKPYNIRVFNKVIDGPNALFFGRLLDKNKKRINCDKLPPCGYTNFSFNRDKTSPQTGDYYTFVRKTGTLYKANVLKRQKLAPDEPKYEQIPLTKREVHRLRIIFRLY